MYTKNNNTAASVSKFQLSYDHFDNVICGSDRAHIKPVCQSCLDNWQISDANQSKYTHLSTEFFSFDCFIILDIELAHNVLTAQL